MSPSTRRVAAALLYVLALGAFFEGSTRLFFRALPTYLGRIPGDNSEVSWRLRWMERHSAHAATPYSFDVYDSARGWAVKPGLRDLPVFDGKKLSSNSKGIRGDTEYPYQKAPGTSRVGVFGDSFTFGEEVSDDETFSHRLGRLLPRTEVLNFGVHGYGHDQMLMYLREEGVKYHPDLVILGFVIDDVARNILAFRDYSKPRFALDHGRLIPVNTLVPTVDELLRAERYRLRFVDAISIVYEEAMWRSGVSERAARQLTTRIMDEMRRTVDAAGGRMLGVYLPMVDEINDASQAVTPGEQYFLDYCHAQGLACMSTRPALVAERRGKDPLVPGKHWPPAEHNAAALAIRDYVLEKGLLPPPG